MMPIIIFAASFFIYTLTLSPTIAVGDSPELISSSFTLGIAHPPGYPLFSIFGKMASSIPIADSIAYRVNLLSAFLGSLTVLFLYLTILEAIRFIREPEVPTYRISSVDRLSSLIGSLFLAVSPLFWSQAVVAEVYTLNAAFFTCLLWLCLKWVSAGAAKTTPASALRLLYLISFLWGLSIGNHHTMLAFGPAFFLFAGVFWLTGARRRLAPGGPTTRPYNSFLIPHVLLLAFFFLLGLSVYLYMPVRSMQNPFMDWGDTEKIGGFLDVLLRKQFGLGSRDYSFERAVSQTGYYLVLLKEQFTMFGLILGVSGAFLFARRAPWPFLLSLGLFIIFGITTIFILNPVPADLNTIDVMVLPSFAVFSVWIGLGLLFAYSGVLTLFIKGLTEKKEVNIIIFLSLILLLIPSTVFYTNLDNNDQSGNTFARDYAMDILENIEPDSVLFVEADLSLFPLWYMQYVEGKRKDVAVLDVDMLMLPWFKRQLKEKYSTVDIHVPDIIRHSKGGRFSPLSMEAIVSYKVSQVEGMADGIMDQHPTYLSFEFGVPFMEFGERKDFFLTRKGIVFMVSRESGADALIMDFHALKSILKAIKSRDEEVLFIARGYKPAMERMVSKELSSGNKSRAMNFMEGILAIDPYNRDSLNNLAYFYAEEGIKLDRAERMVKRAMSLDAGNKVRYMKTLGFIYLKKGNYLMARETFAKVLEIEPQSQWTRLQLDEALKGGGK